MSSAAKQARAALGVRLREIRQDANLTGRTLAVRCGWHFTKVSKLEHGTQNPSVVIRGAVYRVDLGAAKRGHEQRGRRLGLVLSPSSMPWSVATIVPTSTTAQPAVFRPTMQINGQQTRFLVDQIRSIDTDYLIGDPVHYLEHDELAEVEHAVLRYLGL